MRSGGRKEGVEWMEGEGTGEERGADYTERGYGAEMGAEVTHFFFLFWVTFVGLV